MTNVNTLTGFLLIRIGGFVRFVYGTLMRKIGLRRAPYYSLREYIHGSERPGDEDWDNGYSHEFINKIIGLVTLGFAGFAITQIERLF